MPNVKETYKQQNNNNRRQIVLRDSANTALTDKDNRREFGPD